MYCIKGRTGPLLRVVRVQRHSCTVSKVELVLGIRVVRVQRHSCTVSKVELVLGKH